MKIISKNRMERIVSAINEADTLMRTIIENGVTYNKYSFTKWEDECGLCYHANNGEVVWIDTESQMIGGSYDLCVRLGRDYEVVDVKSFGLEFFIHDGAEEMGTFGVNHYPDGSYVHRVGGEEEWQRDLPLGTFV